MPSSFKQDNPGCDCCDCVLPECTLTGAGGGSVGGNVNLTWTTVGADTVTIYDDDLTLISTALNGTSVLVSGGACKTYTLTATNVCGNSVCTYLNSCPDPACSNCLLDTGPDTLTVIFTNNGRLNNCGCTDGVVDSRCAQFDGSFTVTQSVSGCEWTGGPFGSSVFCEINRNTWSIRVVVQYGDCDGNDTGNLYAHVIVSYSVVDPPTCRDLPAFSKLLGAYRADCDTVTGVYDRCLIETPLCDIECEVA